MSGTNLQALRALAEALYRRPAWTLEEFEAQLQRVYNEGRKVGMEEAAKVAEEYRNSPFPAKDIAITIRRAKTEEVKE